MSDPSLSDPSLNDPSLDSPPSQLGPQQSPSMGDNQMAPPPRYAEPPPRRRDSNSIGHRLSTLGGLKDDDRRYDRDGYGDNGYQDDRGYDRDRDDRGLGGALGGGGGGGGGLLGGDN
jgi:hypothetical protein